MAAKQRFSLMLGLGNTAPTQSLINNFNSFSKIGDVYLAANEDGIHSVNQQCSDANGINIDAYFKLKKTDFGIPNEKRLRSMYIGYETSGSILMTITADEYFSRSFILSPMSGLQMQHGIRVPLTRDLRGRYFEFYFENINGCDFSIDCIDLIAVILGRRPRGI